MRISMGVSMRVIENLCKTKIIIITTVRRMTRIKTAIKNEIVK